MPGLPISLDLIQAGGDVWQTLTRQRSEPCLTLSATRTSGITRQLQAQSTEKKDLLQSNPHLPWAQKLSQFKISKPFVKIVSFFSQWLALSSSQASKKKNCFRDTFVLLFNPKNILSSNTVSYTLVIKRQFPIFLNFLVTWNHVFITSHFFPPPRLLEYSESRIYLQSVALKYSLK